MLCCYKRPLEEHCLNKMAYKKKCKHLLAFLQEDKGRTCFTATKA